MTVHRRMTLAPLALCLASIPLAALAAAPRSLKIVSELNLPSQGGIHQAPIKQTLYFKGNKMRLDSKMGVVIFNGGRLLMFNPYSPKPNRQAVSLQPPGGVRTPTALLNTEVGAGMKHVGSGKVLGHPCDIRIRTMGGIFMKLWVAKDLGVPVPLRTEERMIGLAMSAQAQATSVSVNPSLPDSLFVLPKGYKIMSAPLPPGMPATHGPQGARPHPGALRHH